MLKKLLPNILFGILIPCSLLSAQSSDQFEKNPKTKIPVGRDFLNSYEGLEFRWPSLMPFPMKFTIGEYKVAEPHSVLLDNQTVFVDRVCLDQVRPLLMRYSEIGKTGLIIVHAKD